MKIAHRIALAAAVLVAGHLGSSAAVAQTIVTLSTAFLGPIGVTVDRNGDLFALDYGVPGHGFVPGLPGSVYELPAADGYTSIKNLATGFGGSGGLAVDGSGNLFVANGGVQEILAAGGYTTVKTLGGGFVNATGLALDASGNVFVADHGDQAVKEILAAGGYTTVNTLGAVLGNPPNSVAVDSDGNVFVTAGAVDEIPAAGGYVTTKTISTAFLNAQGITVDGRGNLFVTDDGGGFNSEGSAVKEILAAGGYVTVNTLGQGFATPGGIAVDARGDVFVADDQTNALKEIVASPPTTFAAVLPGARSVQLGNPATFFATIVNSAPTALDGCKISLTAGAPSGLTLEYQTTDPATNALTGSPNTPVTIQGKNASQTFVISLVGTSPVSAGSNGQNVPLDFGCDGAPPALNIPGVDTVDLTISDSPVPDILMVAATPTNDGILDIPLNGTAAFSVATTNIGATASITPQISTGTTFLPMVGLTICQTDPTTGQCISTPSDSVSYPSGTVQTFSIFVQSSAPIALAPASSRILVQFVDDNFGVYGSTSVAIESH